MSACKDCLIYIENVKSKCEKLKTKLFDEIPSCSGCDLFSDWIVDDEIEYCSCYCLGIVVGCANIQLKEYK